MIEKSDELYYGLRDALAKHVSKVIDENTEDIDPMRGIQIDVTGSLGVWGIAQE